MRAPPMLMAIALVGPLLCGCNIVGPLLVLTAPPQIQPAEVELTKSRLALVIEYASAGEESPVFTEAFRQRLTEVLREKQINERVIPRAEVLALRRDHADYPKWSIQKVGQALNAEQVLYVRVERLALRAAPEDPVLAPEVRLRMKLIAPWQTGRAARLWPPSAEREGREIYRARPMREAGDAFVLDEELAKLGREAAWLAAKPFYKVDLEEKDSWEP